MPAFSGRWFWWLRWGRRSLRWSLGCALRSSCTFDVARHPGGRIRSEPVDREREPSVDAVSKGQNRVVSSRLRAKLVERTQPYLPGEAITDIFQAQTLSPWTAWPDWVALFRNRLVIVAATDEQIAIFQAKFTSPSTPKKLRARLPRNVAIGPVGDAPMSSRGVLGGSRGGGRGGG